MLKIRSGKLLQSQLVRKSLTFGGRRALSPIPGPFHFRPIINKLNKLHFVYLMLSRRVQMKYLVVNWLAESPFCFGFGQGFESREDKSRTKNFFSYRQKSHPPIFFFFFFLWDFVLFCSRQCDLKSTQFSQKLPKMKPNKISPNLNLKVLFCKAIKNFFKDGNLKSG